MSGPKISGNPQPEFPNNKPIDNKSPVQRDNPASQRPHERDKFKKIVEGKEDPTIEEGEIEIDPETGEPIEGGEFGDIDNLAELFGKRKNNPDGLDKRFKGSESELFELLNKHLPQEEGVDADIIETDFDVEVESEEESTNTTGSSSAAQLAREERLSGVGALQGDASEVKAGQNAARAEVWSIVEKLVDKITELKSTGKTEITITLKEPPLFQGAQIRIEEFNHAKNEFNIDFENLSPRAQELLEANKAGLKQALEERGYVLHIMTTNLESARPQRSEEGRQQQGRDQGGGGQREGREGGEGGQGRGQR